MNIQALGYRNETSGHGVAFRRHVKALRAIAEVDMDYFENDPEPALIRYLHGGPLTISRARRGLHQIGYMVCESTKLVHSYYQAAAVVDEIWTCSRYCQEILQQLGRPVAYVPHYCDTDLVLPRSQNDEPTFLIAFNGHSRVSRKHPALALRAIKLAGGKKVTVKALNVLPNTMRWLRKEAEGLDVTWIEKPLTEFGLAQLYSSTDILVSLHASEGFGLHLLEAMVQGCRVVATAYSGNSEFMNEKNSFPVQYRLINTYDDYFQGVWARPDLDHAVFQIKQAMATIHNQNLTKLIQESTQKFSLSNTIEHSRTALGL